MTDKTKSRAPRDCKQTFFAKSLYKRLELAKGSYLGEGAIKEMSKHFPENRWQDTYKKSV